MKKWFERFCKKHCLKVLGENDVLYYEDEEEILIKKRRTEVRLKAVFIDNGDDDYAIKISGDHIVVENEVVEAIWKVLWEKTAKTIKVEGQEPRLITFSECRVISAPNHIRISKEEVIPID